MSARAAILPNGTTYNAALSHLYAALPFYLLAGIAMCAPRSPLPRPTPPRMFDCSDFGNPDCLVCELRRERTDG